MTLGKVMLETMRNEGREGRRLAEVIERVAARDKEMPLGLWEEAKSALARGCEQ